MQNLNDDTKLFISINNFFKKTYKNLLRDWDKRWSIERDISCSENKLYTSMQEKRRCWECLKKK